MYGNDKSWKLLQKQLFDDIEKSRKKRGAGEKPKIKKYDPNYLIS